MCFDCCKASKFVYPLVTLSEMKGLRNGLRKSSPNLRCTSNIISHPPMDLKTSTINIWGPLM